MALALLYIPQSEELETGEDNNSLLVNGEL
jgi:hypothetical protein